MLNYKEILDSINNLNKESRHDNLKLTAGMYYDNISKTNFEYPDFKADIDSDQLDYFRFRELELLSHEIKRKQVKGELAEVGVFRGDFSSKMNALFPGKKLYLFDTFSGFEKNDLERDIKSGFVAGGFMSLIPQYIQTNSTYVLNRMKFPEKCILKSGYFPQSLGGLEEVFCLVSIDVDLYLPTIRALDYFYPRLQKNGYIMLHDYNHDELAGVKEAVFEYEKVVDDLILLPIADQCGTLIISK
jgi:O-methyltransferase